MRFKLGCALSGICIFLPLTRSTQVLSESAVQTTRMFFALLKVSAGRGRLILWRMMRFRIFKTVQMCEMLTVSKFLGLLLQTPPPPNLIQIWKLRAAAAEPGRRNGLSGRKSEDFIIQQDGNWQEKVPKGLIPPLLSSLSLFLRKGWQSFRTAVFFFLCWSLEKKSCFSRSSDNLLSDNVEPCNDQGLLLGDLKWRPSF